MNNNEIKEMFKEVLGETKNPFTPEIQRYGKRGDFLYELSFGDTTRDSELLYGVTVLEKNEKGEYDHCHRFSQAVYGLRNANDYIKLLTSMSQDHDEIGSEDPQAIEAARAGAAMQGNDPEESNE